MIRRTARSAAALLGLAASVAVPSGCAGFDRTADLQEFADGRYASARVLAETRIGEGGADVTLDRCMAGSAALAEGDVAGAHRHLLAAFTDLEDRTATIGETTAAIVGPDSSKPWKGDPWERCMNAYYLGVTYWLMGDPDNAAASFRTGLLRDAASQEGEAQSDFGALWYLLGQAQRAAEHEDRGAFAFARAHALLPSNPFAAPDAAAKANVVLAVDVGLGPRKAPSGPHGSQVAILRRSYAVANAVVSEGGTPLGATAPAADVFFQAVTRGGKVMDTVNATKAVVKDAAIVGGAIITDNAGNSRNEWIGLGMVLAGILLPAEADVRHWSTLPGEIHVWSASLAPGEHVLRVEPRDAAGTPVTGAAREVVVTVRPGHVAFAWVRAGPQPLE